MIQTETIEKFETKTDEGELTVIHFIVKPNTVKYAAEWWVQVQPRIFIRACGSKERLGLVYAHNIPVAPQKYFFKNGHEQLHFTLFFPALPKGTTHIDIIENQGGSMTRYFNYYRVPMSKINNRTPLKH